MEASHCQIYLNLNQAELKRTCSAETAASYRDETTDSEAAFRTPRGSTASEPDTEPEVEGSPAARPPSPPRTPQPVAAAAKPSDASPPQAAAPRQVADVGASAAASAPREGALAAGRRSWEGPGMEKAAQPSPLRPSAGAWAPRRRGGAGEVEREIRSILNKLTVEKFQSLSQKLVQCGIATQDHLTLLINEILEKAASQHHFLEMYADLCAFLSGFYAEQPVGGGSFRNLLRGQCRASFERLLAPPEGLEAMAKEERQAVETRYKQRMVGTIRFVGALLTRSLLPGKVLPALLVLLFEEPTPAAIEAATALLTVAGPAVDAPGSELRPALDAAFERARGLAAAGRCGPRARCLLLDLLELRARAWRARPAGARAAPEKLREVARRAEEEQAAHAPRSRPDCRPRPPAGPARDRRALPGPRAAGADSWAAAARPLVQKEPLAKSVCTPFSFQRASFQ